jgi:hypothetical protein
MMQRLVQKLFFINLKTQTFLSIGKITYSQANYLSKILHADG